MEDQPGDGDCHHQGVVMPSAPEWAFCQDGHVGQAVEEANPDPLICAEILVTKCHNEGEANSNTKVDGRVLLEESADDGEAPNLEDETCQEGWGELGHQFQLLEKASVLHD